MNENIDIDLTKILKDCPKWTKFYCPLYGNILFKYIDQNNLIEAIISRNFKYSIIFNYKGRLMLYNGTFTVECLLFPSKDIRTWEGWEYKSPNGKFDPRTFKLYDNVLFKAPGKKWKKGKITQYGSKLSLPSRCVNGADSLCVPYNDDTKHLVGTKDEAPEFYRYWED